MAKNHPRAIFQLKVALVGIRPPIWRRFLVPDNVRLADFHEILQVVMGWQDCHLHQFVCGRSLYGIPDNEDDLLNVKDEAVHKLSQLLRKERDALIYEYDFGDGWEHKVSLEKVLPWDADAHLPFCIKGRRACPPEDCGGIHGYREFVEAMANPSHPEHEAMLEWFGAEFDSERFNADEINHRLSFRFGR